MIISIKSCFANLIIFHEKIKYNFMFNNIFSHNDGMSALRYWRIVVAYKKFFEKNVVLLTDTIIKKAKFADVLA